RFLTVEALGAGDIRAAVRGGSPEFLLRRRKRKARDRGPLLTRLGIPGIPKEEGEEPREHVRSVREDPIVEPRVLESNGTARLRGRSPPCADRDQGSVPCASGGHVHPLQRRRLSVATRPGAPEIPWGGHGPSEGRAPSPLLWRGRGRRVGARHPPGQVRGRETG